MNDLDRAAVGKYEIKPQLDKRSMVAYRKEKTKSAVIKIKRQPGPAKYNLYDRQAIEKQAPKFTIKKEPKERKKKLHEIDIKQALDINLKHVKPS